MNEQPTTKALIPVYRKLKPIRKDVETFWEELTQCMHAIELGNKNSVGHEHIKALTRQIPKSSIYLNNLINTKDRIHLTINQENITNQGVSVVIEANRPN